MSKTKHRFVLLDTERERYYEGDSIQELQDKMHGLVAAGRDFMDAPKASIFARMFLRGLE